MPTITVHHLENSRSQRVLWLLEELGLDYEIVSYARNAETLRAPPELRRIHPLGKAPVVTVDGSVLAETGAILEGLVEAHGPQLRPETPEGRRLYRYWLHYAEGSLAPPLLVKLIMGQVERAPVPFFLRPVTRKIAASVNQAYTDPELRSHTSFVEDHLAVHTWFAGEAFSAADIQMSFGLEAAQAREVVGEAHPHITAWLDRIHERPAYRRALERGGPYSLLT